MDKNEELPHDEPWSGIARYGSNFTPGPEQDNQSFYKQLDAMPNQLIETMLDAISEGNHRFENVPYEVTLLGHPHIITVRTPSIGNLEIMARLLLLGQHSFGVMNPKPWRDIETIAYAKVTGIIHAPEKAHVNLVDGDKDYEEMDQLYWKSLENPEAQGRIDALVHKQEIANNLHVSKEE